MEANLKETLEFLECLPKLKYETICVMEPQAKEVHAKSIKASEVADLLGPLQGTHNCYFHVNEGPKNKKAKKGDITQVRMLHVDIDRLDQETFDSLLNYSIPPSITIMSGGGYQAFWFLDELHKPDAIFEELNNRVRLHFNADACQNIDRIMRLPGTINVPDAKKLKAGRVPTLAYIVRDARLTEVSRRYSLADLLLKLPAPAQLTQVLASTNPIRLADLDPVLLQSIPTDIQELIEFGPTDQDQFPSRSEAVWRVVCALARVAIPEPVAVALLTHPDNAISESILERGDPRAEAVRQFRRGRDAANTGWPDTGPKGVPKPSLANAKAAINRLGIDGFYDSFRDKQFLVVNNQMEEFSDRLKTRIRNAILLNFHFDPTDEYTYTAIEILCLENEIHSIRDAFPRLAWDGQKRLQHLFSWYFGAEDTPLNREISEIFLTAAVRRIVQPGCKFDNIVVLEGPQGSGKSTALTIIADHQNFSDQDLLLMDARTQSEAVRGIWIYEISELQGLHKADVDRVKAFASRDTDRVRPVYGRKRVDVPRQTIFVGTTNENTYLRDTTGNRRFWPVRTSTIRLEDLRQDRLQLIAEAVALEATGRTLVLDEALWPEADRIQKERLTVDSWADELKDLSCYMEQGLLRVSSQDALLHLGRTKDKQTLADFNRVRDAMRTLGWTGPKLMKINKETVRGYEADPASGVPCVIIQLDPDGNPTPPRPPYLRVVDENFTVHGKPATEKSD